MMSSVRLIPDERDRQRDIGDAIGVVHGIGPLSALVSWPEFRATHKLADLELAP